MESFEGNMTIGDLKRKSKKDLKGNKGKAALTFFIGSILASSACSVVFFLFMPSLMNSLTNANYVSSDYAAEDIMSKLLPAYILCILIYLFMNFFIEYGLMNFCLRLSKNENSDVENLFDGFKRFKSVFAMQFLKYLFTSLWSLLFYIPGIIAFFKYKMSVFILYENPDIKATDAIDLSKKMMKGYKGKLFLMYLSFIGWFLLVPFTFYILLLWLMPYIQTSEANFYNNVKANYLKQNGLTELFPKENNNSIADALNDYHTAE